MQRPRIIVNVAMTVDGKIDTAARKGSAISSRRDLLRVDRLRAGCDAVMVGGRTLLIEQPKLTIKSPALRAERKSRNLPENPAKVGVVSEIGREDLPEKCGFLAAGPAKVHIYTTQRTSSETVERLEEASAIVSIAGERRVNLNTVVNSLHAAGIKTVLVEGGGTLISEAFHLGLVDELFIYISPKIFAGASAPTLADGEGFSSMEKVPHLHLVSADKFDEDGGVLLHYQVIPNSL